LLHFARQRLRSHEPLRIHVHERLFAPHSSTEPVQPLALLRRLSYPHPPLTMIRRLMLSTALATLYAPSCVAQSNAAAPAPAKWPDTTSAEIEKAQIANDSAGLAAAVALASRVAIAYPNDGLILHYQGYALYRQGLMLQQHQDASPTL